VGFVKLLRLTSAIGVAYYDDQQIGSLYDVFQHCGNSLGKSPARSSAKSARMIRGWPSCDRNWPSFELMMVMQAEPTQAVRQRANCRTCAK